MFTLLRDIHRHRELLLLLVSRNLKIRYKNSALGFFWTLLGPLLMILIYATFASILRFNDGNPNYLQFLITGIIGWQFLVMCLGDSINTIVGNGNLVKRTVFPRAILPLAMVSANLVNFLLTSVVLVIYLVLSGCSLGNVTLLPLVMITQCALCLGMALIISSANVFLRDTEHILNVVILAWFFLSPIFYTMERQLAFMPSDQLRWLPFLNPMSGLLCAYRSIYMSDTSVQIPAMAVSFGVCWIILLTGVLVFQKLQVGFADEL